MARTIAVDHGEKRRAILKRAARLFAEEGYGRASMAQVAEAVGISKANIYHYYPSKSALLFDILDEHLRDLRDRVCGLQFESDDPADQLQTIATELLLAYVGADAEHGVQLNAFTALPEEEQEALRTYQRDLVRFVRARIAALAPPNADQNSAQMRSVTMSFFAMVNWHYQWDGAADEAARREYAALICGLLRNGLRGI